MEDSSLQTNPAHPSIDSMPTSHTVLPTASSVDQKPSHANKKTILIAGLVILLIVIATTYFVFHRKAKNATPLTPAETLQQLKNSSAPVTTTPEQRATDLTTAQKSSYQTVVTAKKKMDILNALKK